LLFAQASLDPGCKLPTVVGMTGAHYHALLSSIEMGLANFFAWTGLEL
jgi:hypothetical protein